MKKIFALLIACAAFSTASFAAETATTNEVTCSVEQSSLAEKYKSYINRLYQAAVNDDYETFERLLREFESFINNTPSSQMAKIEAELTKWGESNGYKMVKIAEYSEYAEDVREGRIRR